MENFPAATNVQGMMDKRSNRLSETLADAPAENAAGMIRTGSANTIRAPGDSPEKMPNT